ncbi:S8 family serine peptidase [Streptomyces sp. NBC_00053]|uniref:S8 family serine peptidase n=1 Tax=unclassified Streptomyces TaxID=2593676 RepID=UPI002257EA05|nr:MULTISPECIES: S8 family serine peptidase [unclassified Streptomyces]MCX5098321.1 S8 family serine peptidase [Streptomyces sp. NBC_00439]MCX5498178.1 S8 family serine peptidase [Streptomyces sp. NBC_00052]MCX5553290.1 S8 family serine peptidase [Streptomyces sp. NBC_00051]
MTRLSARHRARLLAAGLSLVLLPAGQAVAAGALGTAGAGTDRATSPVHTPSTARTVTLITGDQVTVTDLGAGRKSVSVERPDGATGAVRSEMSDGRITVVPDEARPYLQAGVLDAELFDVTALIEQGLGDPSSDGLPLIVTYTKNARSTTPRGARQVRGLPSLGGAALEASKSGEFWRTVAPDITSGARSAASGRVRLAGGVEKIWLDARVDAAMEASNSQIGTPAAWEAGLTGKGVKVAVLDTGVDLTHPDLKDRVSETRSFIDGQEVADRNGHGTHVSSTVGGSGAASDGKEKGVAPGATLAVGKVLNNQGSGTESQIIAGMEWAAKDVHAKIISMSLGSSQGSDGTDPMAQSVNTLSKDTGTLFVIAAGNAYSPGTIGSPGAADSALTIGAVDSADRRAPFSSQGPRFGDNALKPDLSAPGVDILAARSQLVSGSGPYTSKSGTSMATPHVAGVAALLAEKHPDWSGQQLKDGLMSTSKQISGTSYEVGAGRVDVPSAIAAQITATGSADLGFFGWPYEANKPVTKTLTYTNASDRPVTLALTAEGAPAGVVTLADATLTVPAHGTAQTTVTGDGTSAPVGATSGRIVAKNGDTVVAHTAFGLTKENERYTLTVHVKDRDGAASAAYLTVKQLAKDVDPIPAAVDDSGTLKLRLQPGMYALSSFLDVRGSRGKDSLGLGLLTEPEVTMDRDREVTLDGTKLREIRTEVDQRTETRQLIMKFNRSANGASFAPAVQVPPKYDSIFAAPTRKPATGTFEYRTVWRLGKPQLDVEAGGKRLGETAVQYGSDMFTGQKRMALVDAGAGSTADYTGKDVAGRAVVVRRTDAITTVELAQNARDAGARALFVTDEAPGRLMADFSAADGETRPLYSATVNAQDGARLIEAARLGRGVELTGTEFTPYVYDLSKGYSGAIPADLTYRPGKRELAVVNNKFHAPKAADGGEFRYSITDSFPYGMGFQEKIKFPAERTDYVSAGPDQGWHESMSSGPGALEERSGIVHYRGGTRSGTDWFKPVLHPWLGTGLGWGQRRAGNDLEFNTPGWGDSGPDHTGFGEVFNQKSLTQFTEVYVDGVQVDRKKSSGVHAWRVKPTEQDFKVVTDTTMDPDVWRLSTKGHSEWTFKSSATPADRWTYLPMLNLGFDIDTDLHGDVRAGKRLDLGIFSEYVKGASDTGRITGSTLEVSFDDGATWTSVGLDGVRGKSAAWTGSVRVPDDTQYISVRASAADNKGGSVEQEIIRAVGVRK